MKYLFLAIQIMCSLAVFAQSENIEEARSNKHYIGVNLLTPLTRIFASEPVFNEWKAQYKGNYSKKNYFLRASYANFKDNFKEDALFNNFPGKYLTDTTSFYTKFVRETSNFHILKVGLENQFSIGNAKKISINIGADVVYRFFSSSFYSINDTIFHNNYRATGNLEIYNVKGNTLGTSYNENWLGVSPVFALGVPFHKNFDFTFEFTFDLMWNLRNGGSNFYGSNYFEPYYKPSIVFSYTFMK